MTLLSQFFKAAAAPPFHYSESAPALRAFDRLQYTCVGLADWHMGSVIECTATNVRIYGSGPVPNHQRIILVARDLHLSGYVHHCCSAGDVWILEVAIETGSAAPGVIVHSMLAEWC